VTDAFAGVALDTAADQDETITAELDAKEWRSLATVRDRIEVRHPNASAKILASILRRFQERHGLRTLLTAEGERTGPGFIARRIGAVLELRLHPNREGNP
jgi:hypothetical protein